MLGRRKKIQPLRKHNRSRRQFAFNHGLTFTLRILNPQLKVPNDPTLNRPLLRIKPLQAAEDPNQPNRAMELPEPVRDQEWRRLAIQEELLPGLVIAHVLM